jgi:esterase/lipase superfamily enzyme
MELLVFGHAGPRTVVFPTREGRFYDYENFGMVGALAEPLEEGRRQLFCVDSIDSESFYGAHLPPGQRIVRHQQYEDYILEEVLPLTSLINDHPELVAHGCSIGAYHATNIALRHPRRFQRVVALSGRYDLTEQLGPFPDLFDGYRSDHIRSHTPNYYVPRLRDWDHLDALRRMEIMLVIGAEDPFFESTQYLANSLWAKEIRNRLVIWNGEAHRASYWRKMVKLYL